MNFGKTLSTRQTALRIFINSWKLTKFKLFKHKHTLVQKFTCVLNIKQLKASSPVIDVSQGKIVTTK